MLDGANPHSLESEESETSVPDSAFPTEPFPCPNCGQMLAPAVRVCVACKQAVDPARIKSPKAVAPALERLVAWPSPVRVPFPWPLFLLLLLARFSVGITMERYWGLLKAELALGGLEICTAAWVFFDAHEKGVPKPLRWGLGALLLWIVVFPWYLARRKMPKSSCLFDEAVTGPVARALFLALVALFLLSVLFILFKGPLPK